MVLGFTVEFAPWSTWQRGSGPQGEHSEQRRDVTDARFTHLDRNGHAHMVDVSQKSATRRWARAACRVITHLDASDLLVEAAFGSPQVLETARVAGIQAAKRTSDLLPLCHPLLIEDIHITFEIAEHHVVIKVEVLAIERTGVEMEALTGGAVAALTIYDMCKSRDPEMSIEDLCVWDKAGGRSGVWHRVENGEVVHLEREE